MTGKFDSQSETWECLFENWITVDGKTYCERKPPIKQLHPRVNPLAHLQESSTEATVKYVLNFWQKKLSQKNLNFFTIKIEQINNPKMWFFYVCPKSYRHNTWKTVIFCVDEVAERHRSQPFSFNILLRCK